MEPGALQQAQASGDQQQKLWDQAPGWRNLVVAASLLTVVALALPLIPEPTVKPAQPAPKPHPLQAVMATPAPATVAPAAPAAPAPASPVMHTTIVKPAVAHHEEDVAPAPQTVAPQPATPPAQLASAAPESAAPQSAPEQATADPSKVCLLNGPVSPHPADVGRVVAFEDRAMALARIQLTQSINHGQIDPAYIDNQRVHIDLGNGHIRVVLVPRGMTVSMGDVVMVQSGYRNLNLPCNYVPNLITSDLGPQGNRPPAPQQPSPPLQH